MSVMNLAVRPTTQGEVEIAWATLRCLILAEVDDPRLANDYTHQRAQQIAKDKFKRLYRDWCGA